MGKLNAIEVGSLVPIADGAIYELDVIRHPDDGLVQLVKPRQRTLKRLPNNMGCG